ncbi:ABC transporter substrate-binding protein [uncultured Desulfobacter sp.]|uniref:ABC transporter substrate-binding protein n=1 Tax=uncultured Desulfobacter sp. TaxID=240139 RepID=UPI002AAB0C93|nr:ABC transporter substrate-binding protein [uncultured Desulfobacter sp.]
MNRYFLRLVVAMALTLPASAFPANTGPLSPKIALTNCGFTQTFLFIPRRAVTMNQSATEVMLMLGLETHMAGTAYLDDEILPAVQKAYKTVPVIAQKYPSREVVLGVDPDFVYGGYASAFSDQAAGSRRDLAEMGIRSYLSPAVCKNDINPDNPVTLSDVFQEVMDIGQIFGVEKRAQELVHQMKNRLANIRARIGKPGKQLSIFWYDSGEKTPFVGAGTGMPNYLIESVNAVNIFKSLKGGWKDANWEDVIALNPDLIVLVQAGWSTAAGKKAYLKRTNALRDLDAVKNNHFAVIEFSYTTPGIRNVAGVEVLARQLYPDKF